MCDEPHQYYPQMDRMVSISIKSFESHNLESEHTKIRVYFKSLEFIAKNVTIRKGNLSKCLIDSPL